jgi:hypothetical protein
MISIVFLDVYDSQKFLKVPINCRRLMIQLMCPKSPIKKEERREFELGILNRK